jgi:cysteinyl-tRNA synthetase
MLTLYNTLTRKKEEFKPLKKGEVGIYTCGPTVYWYQHIGNMRAYIFSDVLQRVLEYNSLKVKKIINITDVGHLTSAADTGEDKMEKAAKRERKTANEIADFYFKQFDIDLHKLNIKEPFKWTKATEHIKEQIELIKKLEAKGFTYKTSDGIYFDSTKFKDYGKLARLKIDKLQAGKRIDMGEKKNATDFALWKFSNPEEKRQQEWASPWGVGFPGWHIECSAMSMKYLGETFDIHTGGEDHIPVHHTNEIAQSEAATGKKFVHYWMHNAFLTFKGEKVSKSEGGLYTISELEKMNYSPLTFRYLCLLTLYRYPLDFSLDNLEAAKNAYEHLVRKVSELRKSSEKGKDKTKEYQEEFLDAINDDLNTPLAIQVVWKLLDDSEFDTEKKLALLEKFDNVLGLGIKDMREEEIKLPDEIKQLVDERENARKEKKWKEADTLRNKIKDKGYVVEDSDSGPRVTKI